MDTKFWLIITVMVLAVIIFAIGLAMIIIPPAIEKSLNKVEFHPPYALSSKGKGIHQTLQIMDWHCDSLLWDRNLLKKASYGHVDVPRLIEGNVLIQMFTAVTKSPSGQNYRENKADSDTITALAVVQTWPFSAWTSLFQRAMHQSNRLHKFAERSLDRLRIVKNQSELQTALEDHQGSIWVENNPEIGAKFEFMLPKRPL